MLLKSKSINTQILIQWGFRFLLCGWCRLRYFWAKQYPQLQTLLTVQDLGGWDAVQKEFFGDGAIFAKIQAGSKV